jgi:hypothetical protein
VVALWIGCSRIEVDEPAAEAVAEPGDRSGAGPEAGLEAGPETQPDDARFVVQTAGSQPAAAFLDRVVSRYGPGATVEPLFPEVDPADDPEGMARMYRVTIPRDAVDRARPWDAAYALEEELDLAEAEPDFEATYSEELEAGRLCFVDDEPPTDKAWSLKAVGADAAWQLEPPGNGRRLGEGISVCHPDTGWADHVELDGARLDLVRARNLLAGGAANGQDPLDYAGALLNPGHGTSTAAVIVSEHEVGEVLGMAPKARLVPIRTAKSVVQVLDSDLARAVSYAVDADCDVISMSLGGRAFFGLRAAIRRAVRSGLIVVAAAGNCVRFVVAPAAYPECLAIAGTNVRQEPWRGSSRGRAVDVSAPGEHVWTAKRSELAAPITGLAAGQGTSFAVANVAGAAALWLAYHDANGSGAAVGGATVQETFRELLARTATVPEGWDADYGAGILNVEALLAAAPAPPESLPAPTESGAGELELLAAVVDRTPAELAPLVAGLFGVPVAAVEDELERWGPELIQLALADPAEFERLLGALAGEEEGRPEELLPGASERLQRRIP